MAGEGLPLVERLLGRSRHRTTAGYAHLADAHLVEAAETVGAVIAAAMAGETAPGPSALARRPIMRATRPRALRRVVLTPEHTPGPAAALNGSR